MLLDGAIIFGDLIGKLGAVRIECTKCGRSGKYRLAVLITKYGPDEKLFTWTDELMAGCPRQARRRREQSMRRATSGFAEGGVTWGR